MNYYPAFLNIRDKKCVVLGGGNVAAQKVKALLHCGGCVTVVTGELKPALRAMASRGKISWVKRHFLPVDLRGAFLTVAATDNARVNHRVWKEAEKRGILVNVVDDPAHCNFIVPSIYKRGKLHIAISTGGASPAIAKGIRKKMQGVFGQEYDTALRWMGASRKTVQGLVPTYARRKRLFSALAAGDIPASIKRRGRTRAKKDFDAHLNELLQPYRKS